MRARVKECTVVPGKGTGCDSEIMVLCRGGVCVCARTCACVVHKRCSPAVVLFNQYPGTNVHAPPLHTHSREWAAFIKARCFFPLRVEHHDSYRRLVCKPPPRSFNSRKYHPSAGAAHELPRSLLRPLASSPHATSFLPVLPLTPPANNVSTDRHRLASVSVSLQPPLHDATAFCFVFGHSLLQNVLVSKPVSRFYTSCSTKWSNCKQTTNVN